MKTKLERTLLDRSKQVAVIIPLLVGGAFIVVEAPSAWAAPSGYEFKLVSSLGAPAPGGGTFINDFEPGGSIIRATWPSEHRGQIAELGRTNGPAPGGGFFDFVVSGQAERDRPNRDGHSRYRYD